MRKLNALFYLCFQISVLVLASSAVYANTESEPLSTIEAAINKWFVQTHADRANQAVVFFNPILPFDKRLADPDLSVRQPAVYILADQIPLPRVHYFSSARQVDTVYRLILENHATETFVLSKQDQRQLRHAERILLKRRSWLLRLFLGERRDREPSRKLLNYQRFAAQYASIETLLMNESDAARRDQLNKQANDILTAWEKKGHKQEIEQALTRFEEIDGKNPNAFWAKSGNKYSDNLQRIGTEYLPLTNLVPSADTWGRAEGWSAVQFTGFSGELKLVEIQRPWLNADVLGSHDWGWQDGQFKADHVLISDGKGIQSSSATQELMPLLPSGFILARNAAPSPGTQPSIFIVAMMCTVLPRLPTQ